MKEPLTTRIPESKCLRCGHVLTGTTAFNNDDAKPEPGNFCLCIRCGAVMLFADDMTLRPFTNEESQQVANDPEAMAQLRRHVRTIHRVNAQKN